MEELSTQLGNLPQELFDQIYDYFLCITEPPRQITISEPYKPPVELQKLGTEYRAAYAPHYYSQNTFIVVDDKTLIRWLRSLPYDHVSWIHKIELRSEKRVLPGSWGIEFGRDVDVLKIEIEMIELRLNDADRFRSLGALRKDVLCVRRRGEFEDGMSEDLSNDEVVAAMDTLGHAELDTLDTLDREFEEAVNATESIGGLIDGMKRMTTNT